MSTAFGAADILLPEVDDMRKWAVVACDQYTGQPEYWERVESFVGSERSTLRLTLPEIYLEEDGVDDRIDRIHEEMDDMLSQGAFREYRDVLVYVERTQSDGRVRQGIVGKIDLEEYDYRKGSGSPVRATESTVAERIPPRLRVRDGAPLELPHIMILIDDVERTVIEPCAPVTESRTPIYDFTLMENGGSIKGYILPDKEKNAVLSALERLSDNAGFNERYGISGYPTLLYAVGDGNHSLATAKEYYERLKAKYPDKDLSSHPARYALAEIVNLHSDALGFEAIQRVVKRIDPQKLMEEAVRELGLSDEPAEQYFTVFIGGVGRKYYIHKPCSELSVGSLQVFLDGYTEKYGGKIDYIHGSEVVRALSEKEGRIGFVLPDMHKSELFPTVIKDGALPRKTFSMGHAEDKRFYVECRKITE